VTRLLLATNNPDKVRELSAILSGLPVELVSLGEWPQFPPTVEDAETLEGNAIKKAREASRFTGLPAVADDTGLEVFYLNNRPGVYSSRFAGPGATYADNVKKLLAEMRGVPPRRRAARFRTVAAFVDQAGDVTTVDGECSGVITEEPRGKGGFGYDPVFLPDGFSLTFGEMEDAAKNRISHRARAFEKMAEILKREVGKIENRE
jgi:XTP/dITP diphosphohydrolase